MREDQDHMCQDGDGAILQRIYVVSHALALSAHVRTRKAPAKNPLTASPMISSGGSIFPFWLDGESIFWTSQDCNLDSSRCHSV